MEICLDNEWGSICDVGWDEIDASVVCGRLDYLTDGNSYSLSCFLTILSNLAHMLIGALSYNNAFFGMSSGSVFLSSVSCNGTESSLLECQYSTSSCNHSEDAGVRCQGWYMFEEVIISRMSVFLYLCL